MQISFLAFSKSCVAASRFSWLSLIWLGIWKPVNRGTLEPSENDVDEVLVFE